jgi:SAM-dependent methyltransferase
MRPTLRRQLKIALNKFGITISKVDPLTKIANRHLSDKGSQHFSRHHYSRWYNYYFDSRRGEEITLMEIGLCRPDFDGRRITNLGTAGSTTTARDAPSLQMWREYFPKGRIIGVDIDDFSNVWLERVEIHQADAGNASQLDDLCSRIGEQFDIIIDDASHLSQHQQIAFGRLFSHLKPGGIYVIEDLHAQFDEALDSPRCTRQFVRRIMHTGRLASPWIEEARCREIEA